MSDERVRATSWSGSERERREQGVCLPPSKPPSKQSRFFIPRGVSCAVRRVEESEWRGHVTTADHGFDRYERYDDGYYEFRLKGWLMLVRSKYVRRWS